MIESNIVVPSVLPDFEVPESAPNYWQELAAYVWVSTLHGMESDGQKVRQEELIDGHSVEMAVHDLLAPWLLEDEDNDSLLLGELDRLTSQVNNIKNELYLIGSVNIENMKTSVDAVKTSVDAVKTSVDAVAFHTDAVSRKPGLNVDTPNLIDDFFSNVVIDSDKIKVAIIAIQSILEGGNLVLDLVAEAIKEQVTASEDNNEVLQEISDRLVTPSDVPEDPEEDAEPGKNIAQLSQEIVNTLTVVGEKLFIPATETEPERSITEVVQNLSVMPSELHLHVSNLDQKESQDYTERWSAS